MRSFVGSPVSQMPRHPPPPIKRRPEPRLAGQPHQIEVPANIAPRPVLQRRPRHRQPRRRMDARVIDRGVRASLSELPEAARQEQIDSAPLGVTAKRLGSSDDNDQRAALSAELGEPGLHVC